MSRVLACHICGMSSISPLCPTCPLDVQQPTISYTPTPLSLIHPPPASLPDTSLRCVLSGCVYLPLHSAVFTASIHLCLFSPAALSYIKSGRDITLTHTHTHTQKHTHTETHRNTHTHTHTQACRHSHMKWKGKQWTGKKNSGHMFDWKYSVTRHCHVCGTA